ncbi:hypothetical protein RUND412_004450 [Rhizina undulata]
MTGYFDISSALKLFRVLSPPRGEAQVASPKPVCTNNGSKALGDFTVVWQFLDLPNVPSTLENTQPATSTSATSVKTCLANVNSSEKKGQRHVTFKQPGFEEVLSASIRTVNISDPLPDLVFDELPTPDTVTSMLRSTNSDGVTIISHASNDKYGCQRPVIRSLMTSTERKKILMQKLMAMFPADTASLLGTPNLSGLNPKNTDIHVFVDNSNVLIGFYERIKKARGFRKLQAVRQPKLSFHALTLILERGRKVAKRVLVGSSPVAPAVLEARGLGYEINILERVLKERPIKRGQNPASSGSESASKTGKRKVEQAVDEVLHLKILESLVEGPPSTIVLVSGDAAVGEYSPGFFKAVERCLALGWMVEVVSFKTNLSRLYRDAEFRNKWGSNFRTVPLDGFVEELLD